jgi:hypothetical protein
LIALFKFLGYIGNRMKPIAQNPNEPTYFVQFNLPVDRARCQPTQQGSKPIGTADFDKHFLTLLLPLHLLRPAGTLLNELAKGFLALHHPTLLAMH